MLLAMLPVDLRDPVASHASPAVPCRKGGGEDQYGRSPHRLGTMSTTAPSVGAKTHAEADHLLMLWKSRCRIALHAHYNTAHRLQERHRILGGLTAVLNVLIGSTIFVTLSARADTPAIKIATGLLSIVAAGFVGIQTFRRDGERAEVHKKTGARFAVLLRKLELFEVTGDRTPDGTAHFLKVFNREYSAFILEAPTAGKREFSAASKTYGIEPVRSAGDATAQPPAHHSIHAESPRLG